MNRIKVIIGTLAVLVLLFQACGKSGLPEEPKRLYFANKLKKETHLTTGQNTTSYFYNEDGTISRIEQRADGKIIMLFQYTYADGRCALLKVSGSLDKAALNTGITYTYRYNGENIIEVQADSFSAQQEETRLSELYTFSYDAGGFVQSCKKEQIGADTKKLNVISRFTTDIRGNITQIDEDHYTDGAVTSTVTEIMLYDNQINPRFQLVSPLRFAEFFSPNNIGRHNYQNAGPGPVSFRRYTYIYNSAGFPVDISYTQDIGDPYHELLEYY